MAVCSHAGCRETGVVQWARWSSEDEAKRHATASHEDRVAMIAVHRGRTQQLIAELEELQEQAANVVEARKMQPQIDQQKALLTAIVDPAPLPVRPTKIAVFACPEHAIDIEKAAHIHDADCKVGDCACDTEPPEPSMPFAAPAMHPTLVGKGWT